MTAIKVCINDSYVKKDGTCQVFLQFSLNRRKVVVPTKISVLPENWNYIDSTLKKTHPDYKDDILIIENCRNNANDIFVKYRLSEKELTRDIFMTELKNRSLGVDFYKWMEAAIKDRHGILTNSSIVMHLSVLNKLREYKSSCIFAEIDFKYVDNLEKWLKATKGNSMNTIEKNLKVLKTYCNIAQRQELLLRNPFLNRKIKREKIEPCYLTEEELLKLIKFYGVELMKPAYRVILKAFLFACFTGLRLSDVKALQFQNIVKKEIHLHPKKQQNVNNQVVRIPLNKSALKLIKQDQKNKIFGTVFKMYTDQTTNDYLKDIAILAKVNKEITFHVARHTFATLFLKYNRRDIVTLQKLMGHARLEETMKYIHFDESIVAEAISCFDKFMD